MSAAPLCWHRFLVRETRRLGTSPETALEAECDVFWRQWNLVEVERFRMAEGAHDLEEAVACVDQLY